MYTRRSCPTGIVLCRHTRSNGRLCNSPAMSDGAYCFFHAKLHRNPSASRQAAPGYTTNVPNPLRNTHNIQDALAIVLQGLAAGHISRKRAGCMLYVLQMASKELASQTPYLQ